MTKSARKNEGGRESQCRFQVPLNTDHRLTAEQLFVPDEKKEERDRKKREKKKIREIRRMRNESKIVKTKGECLMFRSTGM